MGIILDSMGGNDAVIGGTVPQRMTSCLATLNHFLQLPNPVLSCFVGAEKASGQTDKSSKADLVESISHILGR